jgi:hypothetical protein
VGHPKLVVAWKGRATAQQENSAYNGHFESTCYHPLLLFNGEGDCLTSKLRAGNVHSAEDWAELLLPEIERQQELGKEGVFRADAAFAKPEIYEAMEDPVQRPGPVKENNDALESPKGYIVSGRWELKRKFVLMGHLWFAGIAELR